MDLTGKVVVVTGAARGQGAAEATALAAAGATVVATDVLPFTTPEGGRHLDVTSYDEWAALAEWLRAEHGEVHGLVNNAGVAGRDRLPDVPLDAWNRTFAINVTGPLLGIQAWCP